MKILLPLLVSFLYINSASASLVKDSVEIQNALKISVTQKVDSCLAEAAVNLSAKPLEAIENYRSALKINVFKTDAWEADIRSAMGKLLFESANKEALAQLITAGALYKKTENLKGRVEVTNMIASLLDKNGSVEDAKKAYDVLIKLQREQGETVLAGNAAFNMANLYFNKQKYNEAFKYAAIAQTAYYEVCRKDSLGSIYLRIAQIKKKLKSPKLAEFYVISRALPYFSASDNLEGRRKGFEFLGNLYQEQKRLSQAKWFYLQANTLSRSLKDTANTITSLINIGIVKIAIGDMVLAKKDFAEADLLAEQGNCAHLMKNVKLKYSTLFKSISASKLKTSVSASKSTPITELLVKAQSSSSAFINGPGKIYTGMYQPSSSSAK